MAFTATNGAQSLALSIGAGITVPVPADGTGTVTIAPADVASWPTDTAPLAWTLVVTDGDGVPFLVDSGTLTVLGATGQTTPATCAITGTIQGCPASGAFVRYRLIRPLPTGGFTPVATEGISSAAGTLVVSSPTTFWTDSTGIFSISLPRGSRFVIECPAVLLDHVGTVPEAATADILSCNLQPRRAELKGEDLTRPPVFPGWPGMGWIP